jgi:hypothetical protein
MKNDLTELQLFLKEKDICLLGNARSILNTKKDIDKFEIVCRINRGIPQGREEFIGKRTDVLFTATKIKDELYQKFNAKYVVWTTVCQNLATDWTKKNAIQNPIEDWKELKFFFPYDKLPSTGLVTLHFLIKHIDFKSLTIFGFDNFATMTYYNSLKTQPWHLGDLEKEIMLGLIKNKENIKWIIE